MAQVNELKVTAQVRITYDMADTKQHRKEVISQINAAVNETMARNTHVIDPSGSIASWGLDVIFDRML